MNGVDRYELLDRLGEGSMGIIYRAKDRVLDREVALKTLSIEGAPDSELIERFCREARACAKLRHPNIVTVFDFDRDDQRACIVMELLEGRDLKRIIADGKPMPLEEKLRILAAVCDGLEHAHRAGIVHRDIKPSNIFLETNGQPRILDFGVAHVPASSLTTTGRALGTPQYMSPEQLQGEPCDGRSDIFSLAAAGFEFIAGRHPFGVSPMARIAEDKPDSLLSFHPELPVEVDIVFQKALSREPKNRYGSASEFAIVLRDAAAAMKDRAASPQPFWSDARVASLPGTETIMSAVLINLQNFENAADHGDLPAARQAIAGMRSAGAQDSRYAIALEQSAKRLAELERQYGPSAAQVSIAAAPKPSPNPVFPPAREHPEPAPASPLALDATVLFENPVVPVAAPIPAPPLPPIPASRAPVVKRAQSPQRGSLIPWVLVVSVLGCAAFAAGMLLLKQTYTEPARRPAVATAEVAGADAPLFANPDAGEKPIATAHKGDLLNVLRAPRSRDQEWTEVQWIYTGHATPAAFAHTSDLGNWFSSDLALAAELKKIFDPETSSGPRRSAPVRTTHHP